MDTAWMRERIIRSGDRGQLIPVTALALVVLMGTAALAVDVGYWRYSQRVEQAAADSAAIAGASEINYPVSNDVTSAARNDATLNGFTNGVAGATVVINGPPSGPASGPYAGNPSAVEAIITKQQPTFFAGIFGGPPQVVQVRAVAILSPVGGGCIYVMKGDLSGNLTLNGGGRGGITTNPPCGMVVNGNLTVTGQANVDVAYAAYVGTGPKGGVFPDGQPHKSGPANDPCVRQPGCAYLAGLKSTDPLFQAPCLDTGGVLPGNPPGTNMPPGHYCNGPYSANVTLQPGLFILDKGMFQGAPTQTASGTGVTIYNNCTPVPGLTCDVTLNGGSVNNTIVAATTGTNGVAAGNAGVGVMYYQPPTLVNNITVDGAAGTVQAVGGIYAPSANFTFNGQLPSMSFIVAGTITMNGGGLNVGASNGFTTPGNAVLAE